MENLGFSRRIFTTLYSFCKFAHFQQIAIENIVEKRTLAHRRLSRKTSGFTLCAIHDFFDVFARLRATFDLLYNAVVFARIDCFNVAFILDEHGFDTLDEAVYDNFVHEQKIRFRFWRNHDKAYVNV